MARQLFPYVTFLKPSGVPISNGYVTITLSQDGTSPTNLVCGTAFNVQLDDNGVMIDPPYVWPNDQLLPLGSTYRLQAFTSLGELVFENPYLFIASPSQLGFGEAFGSQYGS